MIQTIGNASVEDVLCNVDNTRRLLIVVLYGGMGGIVSAAALHVLEQLGVSPRENPNVNVIGISAGAGNVLGFCAGRSGESLEIYKRLARHLYERRWYDRAHISDVLGVEYLIEILAQELGTDFLNDCKGDAFAVVTRARDGSGEILSLKDVSCPFALTRASMCMPVLLHGAVSLDGEEYVDGACSASLVDMVTMVRPNSILILGSRPLPGTLPPGESPLPDFVMRQLATAYTQPVREKSVHTDTALAAGIQRLKRLKIIKWAGIFPEAGIPWNEIDPEVLTHAFTEYQKATLNVCSR